MLTALKKQRAAKKKQENRAIEKALLSNDPTLALLTTRLLHSENLSAVVYGIIVYTSLEEIQGRKSFGEQFGEDLSKLYVNHLQSSNPEAAYLYKERLNFLIEKHGLHPLDTNGVEPLQSNYALTPTFLELYGPIDKELRLTQAVLKARKKKVKKEYISKVRSSPAVKELKAGLRENLRNSKVKYAKDGRKVPLVQIQEETLSVYAQREKLKQARLRQDKRNTLFDTEVPLVKIEYYVTRKRRKHLLEQDRGILQAMGQWRVADERRFPTNDNVEVERISPSKIVQAFIRKQRSKRLLHGSQHKNKASPQK